MENFQHYEQNKIICYFLTQHLIKMQLENFVISEIFAFRSNILHLTV